MTHIALAAPTAELRERAMGTDVHILGVGAPMLAVDPQAPCLDELIVQAMDRLAELEARWSRFEPGSEVSSVNRGAGSWVSVSQETIRLFETARAGWVASNGAFDPTVADALVMAGYDRSFEQLTPERPVVPRGPQVLPPAVPGMAHVRIDPHRVRVRLPAGARFDPGGVGKGLAADLIVEELCAHGGLSGLLVNVGGDLRVWGDAPEGHRDWLVSVNEPTALDQAVPLLVGGDTGFAALATSTDCRRRWIGPDGEAHHLIDPGTGRPIAGISPRLVSVVAPTAADAEVASKTIYVRWLDIGPGGLERWLLHRRSAALVVDPDGAVHRLGAPSSKELT